MSNPEGRSQAKYTYKMNCCGARELKSNIVEDAVKNPHKYVGCLLCFGRGWIANAQADEGYVCPECHGDGITLSQLMKDQKFLEEQQNE